MTVKTINFLDLKLPVFLIWISTSVLLTTFVSSSDPCPPNTTLNPCWCSHVSVNQNYWTEPVSTTTQLTKAPEISPTSVEPGGKRRRRSYLKTRAPFSLARTAFYTVVTCNSSNNIHELEDMVSGLRRRWIDRLVVSDLKPEGEDALIRLPSRWLRNTRVKQFEIRNTLLSSDFIHYGSPFDGQNQTMMWFTANNCSLSGQLSFSDVGTVNTMGLNNLVRLEGVDFSRNHLASVRDMAFRYPPANLTTVILSHNNIRALENRVFQYIPKLRLVDLSHNLLESITRSVFASPAKNLIHINLGFNQLSALPEDFFVNMPALEIVNVRSNYLYSMPSNTWTSVWRRLRVVDVTGNYFLCDCSFMWLPPLSAQSYGNGSDTAVTHPVEGKTIRGTCYASQIDPYPQYYDLGNLTRDLLNC